MGKGAVDEDLPYFVGVYAGFGSQAGVAEALESSDLVITVGNIKSDLNTSSFSYRFSQLNSIDIHSDHVAIRYATFNKVYFDSFLPALTKALDSSKLSQGAREIPVPKVYHSPSSVVPPSGDPITHKYLWPRISEYLREGDFVITETGTSYVGIWETKLPPHVKVINQILWSSIGYGVGAAQGAAQAAKELGKNQRTICFEGDGKLKLLLVTQTKDFDLTCTDLHHPRVFPTYCAGAVNHYSP